VPLQHVSFASFCDLAERFEALDGGLRVVAGSQSVHHETAAVEWRYRWASSALSFVRGC
jgi:hypothetical protein